uniref:Afadin n=1 Tax=Schistosoma mansoni TaxID=6183 RepID=A0A5K4FER8_SCHMA
MGLNNYEQKDLLRRIKEWNATRLDLFKISEPTKRNEFNGVVRFFFRGDDGKYQSKCIRITNTDTARYLVNILVEKFHPDLRMLTAGRYAIYEYHTNNGERRLGADEAPLLVQLNWTAENQEGRFILRDESKPQTITRPDSTYQNGSATIITSTSTTHGLKQRKDNKNLLTTQNNTDDKQTRGFVRRWSSGSRKKQRKSSKNRSDLIDDELEQIPDTTFTRTLSNPDEVLRRRRQQRIHNRNQCMDITDGNKRGSLVKIYGSSLNPTIPYILLPISTNDTAEQIVLWTLEKYNLISHVDPRDYCLVMVNLPLRGGAGVGGSNHSGMNGVERLPQGVEKEITLHDKDCVLKFREMIRSNSGVSNIIQIRHRYAVGKDGKRPPLTSPAYSHVPTQQVPISLHSNSSSSSSSCHNHKDGKQLRQSQQLTDMPYLVEVNGDLDHSIHPNGFTIDLTDLFTRAYTLPIKLGTVESMVGQYPNVLINKTEHPDIRPVHCTFCVVLTTNQITTTTSTVNNNDNTTTTNNNNTSNTAQKWKLPKSVSTPDLENFANYSLLLTPSLDGFAKPPGPALIRVNGTRVTGPILISNNAILQLGKTLYLKYIQPIQTKSLNSLINDNNKMQIKTENVNKIQQTITKLPSSSTSLSNRLAERQIDLMNEKNQNDDVMKLKKDRQFSGGTLSKAQTLKNSSSNLNLSTKNQEINGSNIDAKRKSSHKLPNAMVTSSSLSKSDQLPLSIELEHTNELPSDTLMDQYINLIDHILICTQSDLNNTQKLSLSHEDPVKSRSFYLSLAYALYLTYRSCIKKLNTTSQCQLTEREHCISHLTNYMANRIYESVPNFNRNSNSNPSLLIKPLTYWLGNSSELLHFFKNDIDLCSNHSRTNRHQNDQSGSIIQSVICRDALHLLAETVDHCFYYLRSIMYSILQPWLPCLTYPGDLDLQDDVLLDDKPIDPSETWNKHKEPMSMQIILQNFTYLMQQLRKSRVNPALTFQLYSQLFHLIGAYIFNTVLIDTEAKPRNVLNDGNLWLTRLGASRLNRRLDRIKRWAHRQGLELAVECRLQRCTQACQLIMANRTNLDEFYQQCISLISLNSIQLEWLLAHLSDPPPVPDEWIDLIVTGAKEVNDRAYADEIEHYNINTGQSDHTLSELQLNELKELPIPLLLPADGYVSDAVLSGIPDGLLDFLHPLIKTGLIKVKKHSIVNGQIENRPWTNCMRLSMHENEHNNRNQHSILKVSQNQSHRNRNNNNNTQQKSKQDTLDTNHPQNNHQSLTNSNGSLNSTNTTSTTTTTGSVDSSGSHFKEFSTQTVRYQPNKSLNGTIQKSIKSTTIHKDIRTHISLPDLSHANFEQLAKEANVPVKSITQIFLKKINNSLGLSIVAAKAEGHRLYGIYIKDIVPNGAADQDGRLKTGDQILIIGNTNLIGCAQSDAVAKISKQNKSDDGIQMIIAKKAAQYHKIVELIKSRTTTNSMNNNMNHDSRYLQSTELPSSENKHRVYDLLHFNQSQPDLRIQTQQDHNAMNNPSRNTTDKKATRNHHSSSHRHHHYTQQQTDIDKPDNIHTSRPNHHRIDKSKQLDKSKQKIGSLSRSTPSLNLAQVGMDDDMIELDDNENYTDNNAVSNHSPKRSMRSRNRISEKTNRPQSVGSRSGTQVNQQHIQSSSLSFSTTSSESDIIVNEPGEGIEQYHNRESSFRNDYLPTRQQQSEDYRRTESPIKSFKQKYKSHKPSNSPLLSSHHMHENSHSQPNILKNVCNDNQDNTDTVDGKHSPVNSSSYPPLPHQQNHYQDERPRPIVESISNDLSSLESVTSQQTVCSLNESQPITDSYDNIQNKTNSNEHRRIRHQPPPPPPQSNPSLNHNASKTDLIMNKKDGRNEKPTWRETDLDHFTIRNHQHHQDNNHNDEDKNEWNRYKSNENRNNSSINCDNSNEISKNNSPASQKVDKTNYDPSSTDHLAYIPYSTETTQSSIHKNKATEDSNSVNSLLNIPPHNLGQSTLHSVNQASIGCQQSNSSTKSLPYEDEPDSEALKPPSHAVVSTNRWTDEPSIMMRGLVEQTDLPVVHINPQRGRISTRPYQSNETNQLKMENNNNTMPPYKSIGHDRIPQYTSDYRKYDLLGNSTSVQKTASYISTSSYPNQSSSIQFSDSDKFNPVSSQNNRLNMEVHNTSPTYPRPITTPSYVPSPPPVPTAEYPQYHPPERLEPVHWSTYKHCSSTNESHLSPMSTNPINVQSPTTNSSLKPMDQLTNMPDSDSNYPPPLSKYSNKPVVFRSSSPTSSAASRVIAIQSEIAELEAQQRVDSRLDLSSTLDRLRVELQFQKRLAERESNCRTSVNNNISTSNNSIIKETRNYSIPEKSNTLESSQSRSSLSISNTNHSNDQDWVRKRNQAEQELLETQNQKISQLEQEHRAMLIRQELRAKERTHWFENKHQVQSPSSSLSLPRNAETVDDDVKSWNYQNLSQVPLRQSSEDNISQTSTSQNRYGRPRFDNHNNKTEISKSISYSLQHPIQSRLGPQIIESDLNRLQIISGTTGSSVESIRVKKSVSFDKNLETISVYSPPTTPHGSFIEHETMHKSQMPNISLTSGPKNSLNSSSVNSSYKKSLSPPIGFEIDDKTNDKSHQTNRTNLNHSVPRSSSQGKLATNNTPPTVTVKPPPNAELLPFKEKMRLFAQQIGEDLPKERIKASSRQRELQSANNLH